MTYSMFELKNTISKEETEEQFVAIGCWVDKDGYPFHSLIIIKYLGKIYQLHYYGSIIIEEQIKDYTFHKITYTINKVLVPSFIAMCKNVQKTASPNYGFFYSGEYYDIDGVHFSEKNIGEVMTCSGFCINVLKGFLEKDYIKYEEWKSNSHSVENYLEKYSEQNNIDIENIEQSHRRISPMELLCSAFFKDVPIQKVQIDSMIPTVQDILEICSN